MSHIAHLEGLPIICFHMINRKWVTLHILCLTVSLSHLFYDCQRVSDTAHFVQSHHDIFSYDQQGVRDIQCTFYERQSHDIFNSYDKQFVSDIAYFVTGSFMTLGLSHVQQEVRTLHCLQKAVSWHLSYLSNSLWVLSVERLSNILYNISNHSTYISVY